jgi:hypothetical protein
MAGVIKTDQIRCYDGDGNRMACAGSGQDGEMRFGFKWPLPRFEAHGEVVIDRLSGLMWTRDAGLSEFPQTWREAQDFIEKMNRDEACGYRGWRLPERRELFSLISHERINPALPSGAPFDDVFAGYYWTATTCSRLSDQAWYIHLGGGRIQRGMKHGSYMVWPVRRQSKKHAPVSTVDCRPRDASESSSPDAGRYVIDKGALYDRCTGLGWAKMELSATGPLSWTDALDFVGRINAGNAGGHTDWRLPNIRELESLIDVRRHTPALSEGHPFGRVPEGCWSSTTSVYEPRYAWVVYLQDGAVGVGYKRQPEFHAWAVRGGDKKVMSAED